MGIEEIGKIIKQLLFRQIVYLVIKIAADTSDGT
jgi:hypothetical protein